MDQPQTKTTRRRTIFHGHVQGVFFRATSKQIAGRAAVTGFVRNLSDGTVELEVQGAPGEVERVVAEIAAQYSGHITRADSTEVAPRGDEAAFEIRY